MTEPRVNLEELKAQATDCIANLHTTACIRVSAPETLLALIAEVEASRAENEALRKALEEIAAHTRSTDAPLFGLHCIARAALASPADASHEQVIGGREG